MNCLKVFASLLGGLAWILQLVAMVTSNWLDLGGGVHVGFITYCWSIFCGVLPPKYWTSMVAASMGLIGFSIALTSLGVLLNWISCCCVGRNKGLAVASGVFYILSGFFTLVGCICYAAEMPGKFPGSKLSSSFFVAIIAFIICIVSAIMIIIGGKKEAEAPIAAGAVIIQQPQVIMMQQQPGMVQQQQQQQPVYQ